MIYYKECNKCRLLLESYFFHNKKQMNDGLHNSCKLCVKKYLLNNKAKISIQRKSKYYENHTINLIKNKENYFKHKNKRRLAQSKYYMINKLYFKIKNKNYLINNKEYIMSKNRKRQLKINCKNITQKQINDLLKMSGLKCYYCKCDVFKGINLHLDHKIPLSKQGLHEVANLVVSCSGCNLKKSTKTDLEFLLEIKNNY